MKLWFTHPCIHTDLKGAIITSTQQAEESGKNQFTTGSLMHSDIENHANYKGSSFGVSGSVAANFETPFGKEAAPQRAANRLQIKTAMRFTQIRMATQQ